MRRRNACGTLLMLATSGCYTDPVSVSSGATGCPPDEIEFTEDVGDHPGYWKVACRGRVFHCSYIRGRYSTQVACSPEVETPRAEGATTPPPPRLASTALPKKAGGFRFGATRKETIDACTGANHEWSEDTYRHHCSGTAKEMGLAVRSELGFCEGKLCDLTLRARLDPGDEGEAQRKVISRALREQYGTPTTEKLEIPANCGGRFADCVVSGRARWLAGWRWSAGERIVAQTLVEDGHAILAVRYALGEVDDPPQATSGPDASSF